MSRHSFGLALVGLGTLVLAVVLGYTASRRPGRTDRGTAVDVPSPEPAEPVELSEPSEAGLYAPEGSSVDRQPSAGDEPETRSVDVLVRAMLEPPIATEELLKMQEELPSQIAFKFGPFLDLPSCEFSWDDIPSLLEYSDRAEPSHFVPANPFSSLAQFDPVPVGVVSMWVIEGLRRAVEGNASPERISFVYPSLNPRLLRAPAAADAISEPRTEQQIASDAYHRWWREVKEWEPLEAARLGPLESVPVYWY